MNFPRGPVTMIPSKFGSLREAIPRDFRQFRFGGDTMTIQNQGAEVPVGNLPETGPEDQNTLDGQNGLEGAEDQKGLEALAILPPSEALDESQATQAVEAALLQRALGMTIREVRREVTDKGTKTIITEKEVAPDYTAQIFFLKNRRPDRWRDKPPEVPDHQPENNLLEILQAVGAGLEETGDSPEDGSRNPDDLPGSGGAGEDSGEQEAAHAL